MDSTSFLIKLCLVALGRIVWSVGVQWRMLSDWEEHGRAEAEGSWPRWTWHREHLNCLDVCTHFRGFGLVQASGLCSVYMLTSLALFCETLDEYTWNPLCNKNSLFKKKHLFIIWTENVWSVIQTARDFWIWCSIALFRQQMKSQGFREVTHSKGDQLGGQEEKFNSFLLIYLLVTSWPDHVV